MQVVEKTGKTKDIAIEEALRELNASRDKVLIEILEEEKEGILGIFGARPAKVRVTLKDDKKQLAGKLLENMLKHMEIPCNVRCESAGENQLTLLIDGENVGNVIGKRGSTLNAIEYLLNVMVNKEGADKIAVSIDASGYRESRVKSLEELSLKLASKVKETNKSIELEPMTSQERKIIHMTLKNNVDVYTYSKGEEPYRKVVISAKNKVSRGPNKNSGDYNRDRGNRKRRPSAGANEEQGSQQPQQHRNQPQQQPSNPAPRPAGNTAVENLMKSNDSGAVSAIN